MNKYTTLIAMQTGLFCALGWNLPAFVAGICCVASVVIDCLETAAEYRRQARELESR